MFGYVRPLFPELKYRDLELYRATYCGLCRCLRRRCGLPASLTLTYDCTFLALLLWEPEGSFAPCRGRCLVKPIYRRPMCRETPALERAADIGVILTWWKLKDSAADEGIPDAIPAIAAQPLLWNAYRRVSGRLPEFNQNTRDCLEGLLRLERENSPSIDRTADFFARLLCAAVPESDSRKRVMEQLLYHLGRWIYLADARDDLEEDRVQGCYNPIAARYGPEGDDDSLRMTMARSRELACAAFQLGDFGCRTQLLENILYLGLPAVEQAVFDGSWKEMKKQKIWRNDR